MRRFLVLLIASAVVLASIVLGISAFAQARTAKVSHTIDVSLLAPTYESEDAEGQAQYIKLTNTYMESEDAEH